VALKVMMPRLAKDERARKMFLREARSAVAIEHDRIVRIYEADEVGGVPYIAMELLAGESLADYLARTPVPPLPVALMIAYQVAEGLQVAHTHEQKLIHRDTKPANVWLRSTPGRKGIDVRLLDFGLARAVGGDSLSVTSTGSALGTPLYMAPEQWKGKGVDHQSDLFSLGVMLYQMLTGEPPFTAETRDQLMFRIVVETELPPSPAEVNSAVPTDVSAFVMRMIARDKSERVVTAAEVMRALGRLRKSTAGDSAAIPVAKPLPSVRPVAMPVLLADTRPLFVDEQSTTARLRATDEPRRRGVAVWLMIGVPILLAAVVVGYLAGGPRGDSTRKGDSGGVVPTTTKPDVSPPPTKTGPPVIPNNPPPLKVRPPLLDCTGPNGASAAEVKRVQQEWATYLGVEVETRVDLGGGVGMTFVLVPPGKFLMGTTDEELDALVRLFPKMTKSNCTDETPQHAVTITRPMYVGKTEVTRGQFARFTPADPKEGEMPSWPADATHPVVNVSWNGAKAFAAWVGGRSLPPGFGTCRLPTEAEWEHACRAGTRSRYPNGSDDPESLATIANVADASAKKANPTWDTIATDDRHLYTAPVGTYPANRFGLCDTIGNVWEWCEDGYESAAYKAHETSDSYIKP
jgi:formylglycine-generating enzyme required for sulfatase activity